MKNKIRRLFVCLFIALPLLAGRIEARTLVFTYTTPHTIPFYKDQPVRFNVTRDGKVKGEVRVVGLKQTVTLTLHDDGWSLFRPYFLTIYVAPFRGQPLPYPTFSPNPGPGEVTIKVDNHAPSHVFMVIDPSDGLLSGPMAASFIY
jgi:hypothetical protein